MPTQLHLDDSQLESDEALHKPLMSRADESRLSIEGQIATLDLPDAGPGTATRQALADRRQ